MLLEKKKLYILVCFDIFQLVLLLFLHFIKGDLIILNFFILF
jgi:hypothetical protein